MTPDRTAVRSGDALSVEPTLLVGIGASAGGLEALERFFEVVPDDTGMAFIVIQHLSPDFKSLTDDILARRTKLPIHVAENEMPIRQNAIFLIPPRKDMIVSDGKLLLTDRDPGQALTLPIDHFLRSLAQEAGERAVAVILSGTGTDGSRGVKDIHQAGGLVIVQDPDSAKFDGMPRSALDSGIADLTLPPEAIPDALTRHARYPDQGPVPPSSPAIGVEAVFNLLREAYGIDFSNYKPETVSRRLSRRISLSTINSLNEYAQRLAEDPAELNLLYKDLMIGVTRFFRDQEAFDRLARNVLPELIQRAGSGGEFRVWVAGCATGEEAYSFAMLIREAVDTLPRPIPVKIFATDAHRASLDVAGIGIYSEVALADVSPERLSRFFTRLGSAYQVSSELRKMVVFAHHNLLKDPPFTRLDLVSCRNLLIYFQMPAQKRVLSLFHFAMKVGGVLVLGPSESTGEISDEFEPVDAMWRMYRKRRDVRLTQDLRLPVARQDRRIVGPIAMADPHMTNAYDALLDSYMPPSLLVNERGELLQTFAGASKYLKHRDGRVTNSLVDLVDLDLRTVLTGALPRAFKELAEVTYKGLRVFPVDGEQVVNVTLQPIRNRQGLVTHALVKIEGTTARLPEGNSPQEINLGQASRDQIILLESELRHTRENLQAMIEEMETSNEELQATNQELTAANEELQSTNEELHSVNEELYTVNAEFQKKISELTQLSADMDNLLSSTEVHTIFLDRGLRVRKFTPKIAETFNLLPQDVGRRIDHFTYTIDHTGLLEDLEAVLKTSTPLERQVRDRHGHWYLLRVLPYRAGLSIDGVVLTLVNLSEVKQVEAQVRRKDEQLAGILRHSPNWVFIKDLSGRYIVADEAFRRAVECDPIGKTPYELFPAETAAELEAGDDAVIRDGLDYQSEIVIPLADGHHTFLATKFAVRDETGRVIGIGGIKTDVTAIRQAESLAREAVGQRDRFLAMLSHELRNPLAAILNATELACRLPLDNPQLADGLEVIRRRARHMARLVDDLLDLARFTQDKVELRKKVFDLGSTMRGVLDEAQLWFEQTRVTLHWKTPREHLPVDGDPDRLEQVQVNLLGNAAKYTPAGGTVWYSIEREQDTAVIRVRDTGLGLAPEMLHKVFEPFVQADETLDRSAGGLGVGLTLVQMIVGLHGGTVEAHSQGPNEGSEFVVRLPLAVTASLPPISDEPTNNSTTGLRILIVEDDMDIQSSLAGIL